MMIKVRAGKKKDSGISGSKQENWGRSLRTLEADSGIAVTKHWRKVWERRQERYEAGGEKGTRGSKE